MARLLRSHSKETKTTPQRSPRYRDGSDAPSTASRQVFSYYAARSQSAANTGRSQSPLAETTIEDRHTKLSLKDRLRHVMVLLAVVLFTYFLLGLTTHPRVELSGAAAGLSVYKQRQTVYQQTAQKLLSGSLTNRNKVTVDSQRLQTAMLLQYPELQSVRLGIPFFGTQPTVYIQPSAPSLLLQLSSGKSVIVDEAGHAGLTATMSDELTRLALPTVVDATTQTETAGQLALPKGYVSAINLIVAQSKAKGLDIAIMKLPAAPFELDVQFNGYPYIAKFNLQQQARVASQVGTLFALQQRLKGQGITPAEYIDLRVPGRVYYK